MTNPAPPVRELCSARSSWGPILWHPIAHCQRHPITEFRNNQCMTTVGERIVKARGLKGWNRPKLAEETGVPYPTLAGLENGDQQTSSWIPAIAAATGVSALWLASGKGEMAVSVSASQPLQWDPDTVRAAHELIRGVYEDEGKVYDIELEPDLFIATYQRLVALRDRPSLANVATIVRDIDRLRAESGEDEQGGRDERAGVASAAKGKKRARG